MRAVVYDTFQAPPVLAEVPEPDLAPHGALVRVRATGVCRSDWHGWMGHDPDIRQLPHVPGHELAGVVERVGSEVTGWSGGERVTVPFVCACGTCATCALGEGQVCEQQTQPGFTHWGSWAELVRIEHADVNLVPLPDDVSDVAAAALGCRVGTAYRAVVQVGRVAQGDRVAVYGCGGVGLAAVAIAHAFGATVTAVDPDPDAREHAVQLGASEAFEHGPVPADMSIDAIGHPDVVAAALAGLRRRGRHLQVGLLGEGVQVPMGLVIARELEVLGVHGLAAASYPDLLGLGLPLEALVARTIGLEEAPEALTNPRAGGITVIVP